MPLLIVLNPLKIYINPECEKMPISVMKHFVLMLNYVYIIG